MQCFLCQHPAKLWGLDPQGQIIYACYSHKPDLRAQLANYSDIFPVMDKSKTEMPRFSEGWENQFTELRDALNRVYPKGLP